MSSFFFQTAKARLGEGFDWTSADVRVLLLEGETGTDPDPLADFLDALTPEELATDNYARLSVTGRTIERDDPNLVARWMADDVTFPTLGPLEAGPSVAGAVLFVFVTDDADSWPLLWLGDASGVANGSDFVIAFDPTGVVRLRSAE